MNLTALWRRLPVLLLLAHPAAAGELAIPQGETMEAAEVSAEAFTIPQSVAAALTAASVGDTLGIDGFPVAPGYRTPVELRRYDVYAPDSRIMAVGAAGEQRLPHSRRRHFLGSAAEDPITRIGLSVDPESGRLRGWIDGPFGDFQILETGDSAYRLESTAATLARDGIELDVLQRAPELPSRRFRHADELLSLRPAQRRRLRCQPDRVPPDGGRPLRLLHRRTYAVLYRVDRGRG